MNKNTLKNLKRLSREIVPVASLRGKFIPAKKRLIKEKIMFNEFKAGY